MHMGDPVCIWAGTARNSHTGSPRTHNEIVPIRGVTYSYFEYFSFAHKYFSVNMTIQNRYLSIHIHGYFLVVLVIYMILNEGKYQSKSGDSICCDIMMADSLMTACSD